MAMRLKARGQMTIELMAMLPAALVVALVAVNGALFFSECAAFDRTFRSAVNTFAVSPAAGQGVSESCALIQGAVGALHASDHVDVSVSSSGIEGGVVTFTGTLAFHPTLFGAGLSRVLSVCRFRHSLIAQRFPWRCIGRG